MSAIFLKNLKMNIWNYFHKFDLCIIRNQFISEIIFIVQIEFWSNSK